MITKPFKTALNRRRLIVSACAAVSFSAQSLRQAHASLPTKRLKLRNLNTREEIDVCFMKEGRFDVQALEDLDVFFRDWRTGENMRMDRELYHIIHFIQESCDQEKPVAIHSGFRSRSTNDMLRRKGLGAAKNSKHLFGMAIDLDVPGYKLSYVRNLARQYAAGGVGYYPRRGFVHIDTGDIRYWRR